MRIYNGKKCQMELPLVGDIKITVPSMSVSKDFMPNSGFLSLLTSSYDYNEIALIVSGPFELNLCSNTPCCAGFVVQSIEEAISRFQSGEVLPNSARIIDPIHEGKEVEKTIEEDTKEEENEENQQEEISEISDTDIISSNLKKKNKITKKK